MHYCLHESSLLYAFSVIYPWHVQYFMYDKPPNFILFTCTCSITVVCMHCQTERKSVWILIRWLHQKLTYLNLQWFPIKDKFRFSWARRYEISVWFTINRSRYRRHQEFILIAHNSWHKSIQLKIMLASHYLQKCPRYPLPLVLKFNVILARQLRLKFL